MQAEQGPRVRQLAGLPPRYEIAGLLGRGAEKSVYLARDTSLDRQVAIAAIDTSAAGFPDSERLQEARTMARMGDHPHITSIYDVIEAPGALYIVSRFVPGGDLATLIRERGDPALPIGQAVRIAAQVCRALEHVHERGIAHRDVKPSNIYLDEGGNAVLGDFGLADTKAGATTSGREFVGTPDYVAPEQIWGSSATTSDLYSLGCVLCELTTGAPPFRGRDADETIRMHLHSDLVSTRSRNAAVPIALDDLILSLLAKDPAQRPQSSRDVRASLEGILAAAWSPVAATDDADEGDARHRGAPGREHHRLIGRDEERGLLRRLAVQGASGVPGVLFLEGEAGVGKSRLLRQFHADAEERGAIVLIGYAYQDAPVPYRPFVEALLPLAARLSAIDPHDADLVRRMLYVDRVADAPAEHMVDKTGRERLVAALFRTLMEFCATRPIAIVLEDLHWADSASLDLLEHLVLALSARAARTEVKLTLVASARPVEPDHPLGRLLKRLRGEVICTTRSLTGLEQEGVYHVLRGLGIDRPSDQLVHMVHQVTDGNPLFVSGFLDHLKRQGALREVHGVVVGTVDSTDIAMPASMTAVIAERIREISPACHDALVLGAFLGPVFDLRPLASVAGQPPADLTAHLQEAIAAGFLLEDGHTYRFVHPLLRQALYQEPRAADRQQIHLRIVEHLERTHAGEHEAGALEIAHHLMRAGSAADPARLVRATVQAADRAMQSFAWHEAANLLEAAIAAVATGAPLPAAELGELHRRAGIAYFHRFDGGPCVEHLDRAIAAFRAANDVCGLAQALNDRALIGLQLGLVSFGELQAVAPLEEALAQLGAEHRSLRARILATLAESHWTAQNAGRAVALAEQAMQLAREDCNDRLCADISVQLALAHMQHLEVDKALATYQSGIAYARRANHLSGLEQCLQRNAVVLYLSGRLREAERAAVEAEEVNEIVRNVGDASWTSYIMVTLAALRGDYDAAERHGQQGIELLRRGTYPFSGAALLTALAWARAMRNDPVGANQALDLLLEPGLLFEDVQPIALFAQPYRALIRAYAGLPIDSESLEGAPMMEVTEAGFDFSLLPFLCAWVELGTVCDPPRAFPQLVAAVALADERGMAFSPGWPFLIARTLGVAAAGEHRWFDAARFFERAIGLTQGAGATPELLHTQIDYAQALASRGEPEDHARARRLVERALPRVASCPPMVRTKAAQLADWLAAHSS